MIKLSEIWIKDPPEEAVSAFFDGTCKSAYILYIGSGDGLEMNPTLANNKMSIACYKIYKYLHEFYFNDLTFVDSDEISYELSVNIKAEESMADIWVLSGVIDPNITTELNHHGERNYFIRKLHPETIISYYMGMSWLVKDDEPDREEKLLKFYKFIRDKFKLDISTERILELRSFYYDEGRMLELRLRALDILGITKLTREIMKARKNK